MGTSLFHGRIGRLLTTLGGWPRRIAALLCVALAVVSAVAARSAPSVVRTSTVLVVSRDLPAGAILTGDDVTTASWLSRSLPRSAIHDRSAVIGHPIGAAMARGEPLTYFRLLDTAITDSLSPSQVAATIALSDSGQAAIVHTGACIDVYLGSGSDGVVLSDGSPVSRSSSLGKPTDRPIATAIRVLAVLAAGSGIGTARDGLTIVVAVDRPTAAQLAAHPSGPFVATLRPPS